MVHIRPVLDILQAATRTCSETMIENLTRKIWRQQGLPGLNDLAVRLFYTVLAVLPFLHLLFTIIRCSFDCQVLIAAPESRIWR